MKRIFLLPLTAAAVWCAMPVHADEPVETDSMTPDSMKLYELQQIEVTATRVDRKTPVAYADIGQEEISHLNFGRDMPSLLQMTPSVVATSESGNGIGGTAFRLRGSDASRINITTNGVPMNDAESHSIYWYDTPDMASSVGTIQVQRGAGTSTNGTGAFGGSVNMTTAPMSGEFSGEASLSYGSYNTNKQSLRIGSGLMGGHWTVDARFSHISSDGYVDRASTKLDSYMVQAGYYDGGTAVKLISFGGVAKVGLAYDGVTKEQLKTDRRYNSQGLVEHSDGSISFYDNQTDNYTQINNQLILNHRFNSRWTLNVTGHYTYGSGYYNQYKNGQTLSEYGIAPIPTDDPNEPITESNLIRRKSMDNHFGGVVASANYTRGRVQLALGGAGSVYDGGHWGNVMSVVDAPGFPRHEYYRNASTKYDANVFAKINWEAARGLNLYADLQYRFIRHNITGTNDNFNSTTSALQELDIHRTYHFFNPKAGVNYTFARNHKVYVSFAVAQKEPTRSNFTDTKNGEYPTSERLYDWELGYLFHNDRFEAGVNFYYMSYKDQLVATGELSDTGQELSRNIPDSYRRGIELSASLNIARWFSLGANATLSQNRIENYTEYVSEYDADWNYLGEKELYLGTSTLSYSPSVIAGVLLDFHVKGFSALLHTQYVGKQYFTNGRNDALSLDDYCVTNLNLGYELAASKIGSVRFGVQINNLFNTEYCNNGYGYSSIVGGVREDSAFYFPQAMLNVLANVTVRF